MYRTYHRQGWSRYNNEDLYLYNKHYQDLYMYLVKVVRGHNILENLDLLWNHKLNQDIFGHHMYIRLCLLLG